MASIGKATVTLRRSDCWQVGQEMTASGVSNSTPIVSPAHQVHQLKAISAGATRPARASVETPQVAPIKQATGPPQTRNPAICCTPASGLGKPAHLRISHAPAKVCNIDPSAILAAMPRADTRAPSGAADSEMNRFSVKEPSQTPGASR